MNVVKDFTVLCQSSAINHGGAGGGHGDRAPEMMLKNVISCKVFICFRKSF